MVTKSHDELIGKKSQELDLLRKDQGSTMLREKEMRQRLQGLEREYGEVRDALRQATQELDIRTKENDHLVSLLED